MLDCYTAFKPNFYCSKMAILWASCRMGFLRYPGLRKLYFLIYMNALIELTNLIVLIDKLLINLCIEYEYVLLLQYRKILRIDWMQKITNAELCRRIDLTENLMQKIITRKLELFGHICKMRKDRKIKSVVL